MKFGKKQRGGMMDIKNLSWSEIQEIKSSIEDKKRKYWEDLSKRIPKSLSHEEIIELKREFDTNVNIFKIEGRCNRILAVIQELDDYVKKELHGS